MLQRKYNHRNMEIPALTLRQNTDRLCRRTEDASLDKENGVRQLNKGVGWGEYSSSGFSFFVSFGFVWQGNKRVVAWVPAGNPCP